MNVTDLESRRNKILEFIIRTYIDEVEPVGSQTVCRRFRLGLSPATVRNIMAELEELGYIAQPHTSAGRVPTDRGYRYYVDYLMEPEKLNKDYLDQIEQQYQNKKFVIEDIIKKAAFLLSELTKKTSIILYPNLNKTQLKKIEFFLLEPDKIMITLVSSSGLIKNSIAELSGIIEENELGRLNNFLNSELTGLSLEEIKEHLSRMLLEERYSFYYLLDRAFKIMDMVSKTEEEDLLYLGGAGYILEEPEFKSVEDLRQLLKMVEEKRTLLEVLKQDFESEGVRICIGEENKCLPIKSCSIVACGYKVEGKPLGKLGVLGPTRMEYPKAVSSVEFIANLLSHLLQE
jgi:heat-inducible transcriptional repressor